MYSPRQNFEEHKDTEGKKAGEGWKESVHEGVCDLKGRRWRTKRGVEMSMGAMGRKQRIEQGKDKAYLQHELDPPLHFGTLYTDACRYRTSLTAG